MHVLEGLKAARELVANPDTHCKQAFAKDAKGRTVVPYNSDAVSWCAVGAVEKTFYGDHVSDVVLRNLHRKSLNTVGTSLAYANDYYGRECVVGIFDSVIKDYEEQYGVVPMPQVRVEEVELPLIEVQ